jgi:hypothetical protein
MPRGSVRPHCAGRADAAGGVVVRFPGENHELSRSGKPNHRLQRCGDILDCFAEKLIAPAPPDVRRGQKIIEPPKAHGAPHRQPLQDTPSRDLRLSFGKACLEHPCRFVSRAQGAFHGRSVLGRQVLSGEFEVVPAG